MSAGVIAVNRQHACNLQCTAYEERKSVGWEGTEGEGDGLGIWGNAKFTDLHSYKDVVVGD